jgi:hypothetical protein
VLYVALGMDSNFVNPEVYGTWEAFFKKKYEIIQYEIANIEL